MKNLKFLNSLILQILFLLGLTVFARTTEPIDIWKENDQPQTDEKIIKENILEDNNNLILEKLEKKEIIVSQEENNIKIQNVYGLFDPEDNDLDLNMWVDVDGKKLTELMTRLKNKNLSKDFEDLMIKVLFTNSYLPQKNINPEDFLKYKLEWLLDRKKINYIEEFLEANPNLENNSNLIRFLIDEYLSNANINKACQKTKFLNKKKNSKYLDKFKIYCLVNDNKIEEAQLQYDLLKEKGFQEKFYENKINYLLGYAEKPNTNISDKSLLNFHLSYIVNKSFKYEPTEKTNPYIWRYLSSNNLIANTDTIDLEDEEKINLYERAADENTFNKNDIFNIYKQILFNVNQLINAEQVYKNLPNYKARALIYQSILVTDNIDKKISLLILLSDLFKKDDIQNVIYDESVSILNEIDRNDVSEKHIPFYDLVMNYSKNETELKKIKINNKILHRSKIVKYFDEGYQSSKIEKDLKSVYKNVRKNKNYFFSIKDIILLEALQSDGVTIPKKLAEQYESQTKNAELYIPKELISWSEKNQTGLVLLKIIDIAGEDKLTDLDPETLYFIIATLDKLKAKKLRNNIIIKTLPERV